MLVNDNLIIMYCTVVLFTQCQRSNKNTTYIGILGIMEVKPSRMLAIRNYTLILPAKCQSKRVAESHFTYRLSI